MAILKFSHKHAPGEVMVLIQNFLFHCFISQLLLKLSFLKFNLFTQQTKLYYRNIITILSFAVYNISSAYYGNVVQENTTFTNITLPNNIIWTFHM